MSKYPPVQEDVREWILSMSLKDLESILATYHKWRAGPESSCKFHDKLDEAIEKITSLIEEKREQESNS